MNPRAVDDKGSSATRKKNLRLCRITERTDLIARQFFVGVCSGL